VVVEGQAEGDSADVQVDVPAEGQVDGAEVDLGIMLDGNSVRSVWTTLITLITKKLTGSEGSSPTDTRSSPDARQACVPNISAPSRPPSNAPDIWPWYPSARITQISDPDTADSLRRLVSEVWVIKNRYIERTERLGPDRVGQGVECRTMKNFRANSDVFGVDKW
jgi:hypothetical protein